MAYFYFRIFRRNQRNATLPLAKRASLAAWPSATADNGGGQQNFSAPEGSDIRGTDCLYNVFSENSVLPTELYIFIQTVSLSRCNVCLYFSRKYY